MNEMEVKRLHPKATLPLRATDGSAGYDLAACLEEPLLIPHGETRLVPTGIAIALPRGMGGFLFGRSGLGVKHGIAPANAVGVIDWDYRGELLVGLRNSSAIDYTLQPGDRIAQLVLLPVSTPALCPVEELGETARGAGGFGSTGLENLPTPAAAAPKNATARGKEPLEWILASGSPRRKELLSLLKKDFTVITSDVDETVNPALTPVQVVEQLAARKTRAVAAEHPEALVIGSDTIVVCGGEILGKPHTPECAVEMLRKLSGREHTVYTALHVATPWEERRAVSATQVQFAVMTEAEIAWYAGTGEPLDKAGAYGIQGLGSRFITGIRGDYFTVMGLPVQTLYTLLKECCPEEVAGQ